MERLVTAVAPHGLYHFGKATDAALNAQPGGHHVLTPAHRDHESAYAVPPEHKQPAGCRFDDARHNNGFYIQAGGFTQTPLVFDPGTQPPKRPLELFVCDAVMRCSLATHALTSWFVLCLPGHQQNATSLIMVSIAMQLRHRQGRTEQPSALLLAPTKASTRWRSGQASTTPRCAPPQMSCLSRMASGVPTPRN